MTGAHCEVNWKGHFVQYLLFLHFTLVLTFCLKRRLPFGQPLCGSVGVSIRRTGTRCDCSLTLMFLVCAASPPAEMSSPGVRSSAVETSSYHGALFRYSTSPGRHKGA